MNKIFKRAVVLGVGVGMLIANLMPMLKTWAIDGGNQYVEIEMYGALDVAGGGSDDPFTFGYEGGEITTAATADSAVENGSNDRLFFYTKETSVTFNATPSDGKVATVWLNGTQIAPVNNVFTFDDLVIGGHYRADFMFENEGGEPGGEPDGVVVNVQGLAEEDGRVVVRNGANANKVEITFETLWHMKFVGNITVNDETIAVADFLDYSDQKSYLEHYDRQIVAFTAEFNKAIDDTYNITVTTERNEIKHIGNFLWTADPNQAGEDWYIGNSSLAMIAVEYTLDGRTYSCDVNTGKCAQWDVNNEEDRLECDLATDDSCGIPYVEFSSGDAEYDDGSLVVPAGTKVTMMIKPNYGYQVLNVNMAGGFETDENGVGVFTFMVPGGAAYFNADVVAMNDEVNAKTDLVANGSIDLGNQTTLDHGSARLDVSDVELSDESVAKFEEAAEGYEIKNYLDISLYNVTYKGTLDNAWEERVRDLNEPAVITLQLEDGVDGNEIVIVHEKHDGTYEILDTTYDATTNTISFMTTSFSNYAIASRTVATPDTGDMTNGDRMSANAASILPIVMMVGIITVAGVAAIVVKNSSNK